MLIETPKEFTVAEIICKFKSKRHFKQAYEKDGKIIVDLQYLSWGYISQILTGEKLVLYVNELKDFSVPPRLID